MAAYSSVFQVSEYSGLAPKIVDELVGTGNGAAANYQLDFTNVVNGSFIISHGPVNTNTRTALTITTDYLIQLENGHVTLTAAGIVAVGTDQIFANYRYWTEEFNDDAIARFITSADEEIDLITGRSWDTPVLTIEYHDGRKKLGYPRTQRPYDAEDYTEPTIIMLEQTRIRTIRAVYFLNTPQSVNQFWNFDAGTAVFTAFTNNVNDPTLADFTLFDPIPAIGDQVYIGHSSRFLGMTIDLSTLGTGAPTIDWEYWDGDSWEDITETDTDAGASIFTARGAFTWAMPSNWTANVVNASASLFFIRGTLTAGYTIAPIVNSIAIYDSINEHVHPRDYLFEDWGRISFPSRDVPNGNRNVRIDYLYGETTIPALISELSSVMTSIRAYVHISGGSFDDTTNYQIGNKGISVGEVYVNVREVLTQFNKRKSEILDAIGRRSAVIAV